MDSPGSLTVGNPFPGCTYWGVVPPGPCPYHQAPFTVNTWLTTTFTQPQRLADEDIERIAQRVVELIKERK